MLWAYRNTPHESKGEKPSFLLYGFDCRSPTEAALLPPREIQASEVSDYCEKLVLSLSHACQIVVSSIQVAKRRYKEQYDKNASTDISFKVGDWILVRFPQEESGKLRKLSCPWHGPYRVASCEEPNVTATKAQFPDDPPVQVHFSRVCGCPAGFPAGYYWYGNKCCAPGCPAKWVKRLLTATAVSQGQEPMKVTDLPIKPPTTEQRPERKNLTVQQPEPPCEEQNSKLSPGAKQYGLRRARKPPNRYM